MQTDVILIVKLDVIRSEGKSVQLVVAKIQRPLQRMYHTILIIWRTVVHCMHVHELFVHLYVAVTGHKALDLHPYLYSLG